MAIFHSGCGATSYPASSETPGLCGEYVLDRAASSLGGDLSLHPELLGPHFTPSPQTVSDASWVSELLWALFVPFTVYQVRY